MRSLRFVRAFSAMSMAAALVATAASASPVLVSSNPAANQVIGLVDRLQLAFDQPIETRQSTVDLMMTSMPGAMHHGAMRIAVTVKPGADKKGLIATTRSPLSVGSYRLSWHALGSDGSQADGIIPFSVQ